jgi:hypothetical protein
MLMQIELKSFKSSQSLSIDSLAFTANVYVNGKKAGYARNSGNGEEVLVMPDPGCRDLMASAHSFIATKPDVQASQDYSFRPTLEYVVEQLAASCVIRKEVERIFRKDMGASAKRTSIYRQSDDKVIIYKGSPEQRVSTKNGEVHSLVDFGLSQDASGRPICLNHLAVNDKDRAIALYFRASPGGPEMLKNMYWSVADLDHSVA